MKSKFKLNKIFYNNQILKLFSIVTAILFWFIVASSINPEYSRTIGGVKIQVDTSGKKFSDLGLHVISLSQDQLSVGVTGPRYLIGKLNADDFTAVPDFDSVNKPGTYNLNLDVKFSGSQSNMSISKLKPGTISIRFDTMTTKKVPVKAALDENQLSDGYLAQSAVIEPSSVTITGPTTDVAKVTNAVAKISIPQGTSRTVSGKEKIMLVDSKNKEVSTEYISIDQEYAQVSVPVLKYKDVPLAVSFDNLPAGYDKKNISCVFDPTTVRLAGEDDIIDGIGQVAVKNIDFLSVGLQKTISCDIQIPDGIVNVNHINKVKLTVTLNDTALKIVNTASITAANVPSGYTAKLLTDQISGIKLYGLKSAVGQVGSVNAVVDMSKATGGSGYYFLPVTIQSPGSGMWTAGTYTAEVRLKRVSTW
ncbi:MAG TPA: CdaR family protein [Clostridia bacterium]|nr:CdaR family protein [Clostridia bacterium]